MLYTKANVTFEWDPSQLPAGNCLSDVQLNGQNLESLIKQHIHKTNHNIGNPFRYTKYRVFFHQEIPRICNEVFEAIKILKAIDGEDLMAAFLASRLFEFLASYWSDTLLSNGQHYVGIGFWQSLLDITHRWEQSNQPITIHKGTPQYFLAETYFLVGDRDNGFVYLYNGIQENRKLSRYTIMNYPDKSPSYLTATMSDIQQNQMYHYIIRELREHLGDYITIYRADFNPSFTMCDFDTKFLHNKRLENVVFYFVYNFFYLYDLNKNTSPISLDNDFSKIRTLDLVFNLSLFIDEILKLAASNAGVSSDKMFRTLVWWIQDKKQWMTQASFQTLIGPTQLKINDDIPDNVVPILLSNISNPQGGIQKEIYVMLLAYHLRNHSGHNIDQQKILVQKHDEIIKNLFMAIFLAIDLL